MNKKGFTLVELIVVITILAILGTIAFISLQGYSKSSRDGKRLSDVNNIETSLELFMLQTGKYPLPDDSQAVTYSGSVIVWNQGFIGDTVITQLSRNLTKKPIDPLFENEYTYSTTPSRKEYEIMSIYEGDIVLNNINQAQAVTPVTVRINGNYNGVYVKSQNYIIPTPSIITSEDPNSLDFNATTIKSQVVDRGNNIPNIGNNNVSQSTGGLVFSTHEVYNGNLNKDSIDSQWISAYDALLNTYSGSSVTDKEPIQALISKNTDENKIEYAKTIILDTKERLAPKTPSGWRIQDPNCDIDDIIIGSQTWAGCNSTLGAGLEWGQTDGDIGTNNYNGNIDWACYNYNDMFDASCTKGDITMASNSKANNWFTGTNWNGDSAYNTIWGKLYTWNSLDTDSDNDIDGNDTNLVCGEGYHIPTDAEWQTLEQTLGCSDQSNTGFRCDDLGWNGSNGTKPRILANKLKIPLSGIRNTNGSTFDYRGISSYLWSSTPNSTNAYFRYLYWVNTGVFRNNFDKSYAFSVRCIKD